MCPCFVIARSSPLPSSWERTSLSPTRIIVRDRSSMGVTIRSRSGGVYPRLRTFLRRISLVGSGLVPDRGGDCQVRGGTCGTFLRRSNLVGSGLVPDRGGD
jgi:hypothetical protein